MRAAETGPIGPEPAAAAARLPCLPIDLEQIPAAHRRDFVHDLLGVTWDVTSLDAPPDRMRWRSDIWMLDRIMVGKREVSALSKQRGPRRVRADGMDHYQLLMPTSGTIVADCGDHELAIAPGEVAFFELGRAWRIRCSPTAHATFVVPRALMPGPHGDLPVVSGSLARGAAGVLLANHLECLLRTLPALGAHQASHMAQATAHMVAACLDPNAENTARAAPALRAALITRVGRLVDARLADARLSPEDIALELGVSRSVLYRALAPHGGVREYVTDRRVARARALMAEPATRPRVSAIAEACGFPDLASFSHAFRRKTGQSPSAYRGPAAAAGLAADPALAAPAQVRRWLAAMAAR